MYVQKKKKQLSHKVDLLSCIRNVLVVTDDNMTTLILGRTLGPRGINLNQVATIDDALNELCSKCVDLVVGDHKEPNRNGVKLAVAVARHECPVPVMLITRKGQGLIRARAKRVGAIGFLDRPFNNTEVISRFNEAVYQIQS